jgi:hypothetical protein
VVLCAHLADERALHAAPRFVKAEENSDKNRYFSSPYY